jgi:hypothetical protein
MPQTRKMTKPNAPKKATPPRKKRTPTMPSSVTHVLLEIASNMRAYAHVPYSNYQVGAALLGVSGNVYGGCNVENASYGLSICAERTAYVKAVSEGERTFTAIAVVTEDGGTPCGACRVRPRYARDPGRCQGQLPRDQRRRAVAGCVYVVGGQKFRIRDSRFQIPDSQVCAAATANLEFGIPNSAHTAHAQRNANNAHSL